jgi:hypothetical protein
MTFSTYSGKRLTASASTPPPPCRSAQLVTGSAARGAADAEVDPARVRRLQQRELLGDDERSVVGQHHAARADPDPPWRPPRRRPRTAGFVAATAGMLWCSASQIALIAKSIRDFRQGDGCRHRRPPSSARSEPARGRGRTAGAGAGSRSLVAATRSRTGRFPPQGRTHTRSGDPALADDPLERAPGSRRPSGAGRTARPHRPGHWVRSRRGSALTAATASSTSPTRNPVPPSLHQLGHGTARAGDDRRPGSQRFHHGQSERLRELDQVQEA